MKFAETDGLYKPAFRGKPMETTLAGRLASAPKAQVSDQLPKDILGKVNFKLFSFESGDGFNRLHQNTNLGGTAIAVKAWSKRGQSRTRVCLRIMFVKHKE